MTYRLQEYSKRKDYRPEEKPQREEKLKALGELYAIKTDAENDE